MHLYILLSLCTFSFAIGLPLAPSSLFHSGETISSHHGTNDANEKKEELELEHLKAGRESTTKGPMLNPKKPENEEKPALSDNANSLKFPHQTDGFDESVFAKRRIERDNGQLMGIKGDLRQMFEHNKFQEEVDYTPQDIAEYIFWTGDEKGVAAAMMEFLQEGMISKEDAVRFLENVARELALVKAKYVASVSQGQEQLLDFSNDKYTLHSGQKRSHYDDYYNLRTSGEDSLLDYDVNRELTLEQILYHVAKDLFAQYLRKAKTTPEGSGGAQKLSEFIEMEVANGKIPKDLEKDVLEVLVGAYADAVKEDKEEEEHVELENELKEEKDKVKGGNGRKGSKGN